MTSTDLAIPEPAAVATAPLDAKLRYAKFLATSGLLPAAFRKEPGNILYAVEYGEMLGLPPMAAITGIHVIEGKPSISAGLISALVRRAGHKLRVTGDDHQAQAWLTRADDPGFTYKSVWTLERAKQADLLNKSNWKRYPDAMLKARAISEVARDACQEVLLGMQYTADELGDMLDDGGEIVSDGFDTHPDGLVDASKLTEDEKALAGLMPREQRVAHEALRRDGEPPAGAVTSALSVTLTTRGSTLLRRTAARPASPRWTSSPPCSGSSSSTKPNRTPSSPGSQAANGPRPRRRSRT